MAAFPDQTFHGTCGNPDSDPGGAWCFIDPGCGNVGNAQAKP
jgi:hypothetical protein